MVLHKRPGFAERRMRREEGGKTGVIERVAPRVQPLAGFQTDAQSLHVVFHRAISQRMRTRRVIGQHAAQLAHVPARRVRPEEQSFARELPVEFGEHNPGLHARPLLLAVDFKKPVQAGDVENDPRSDRRPGQVRPGGAGRQRNAPRPGVVDDPLDVGFRLHQHNGLRGHPVDARVDGVGRFRRLVILDEIGAYQTA